MAPSFDFKNTRVPSKVISSVNQRLSKTFSEMRSADYTSPYASLLLSEDASIIRESEALAAEFSDASTILVIGIGGSNLGTIAITEALFGKQYNHKLSKQIFFLDTVDSSATKDIFEIVGTKLRRGEKIVTCVISKSGGTTETIALFEATLDHIAPMFPDFAKYTVVITGQDSKFYHFAEEHSYRILTLPDNVGGRYSVFSNVGIFPLAFIGADVRSLLSGVKQAKMNLLKQSENNIALQSACMLDYWSHRGVNIVDHFFFSVSFESVGKWYRQLLGESIGKAFNKDGTAEINAGITPTVSVGSTDLHSMAQLYFGGPKDKMFVLVRMIDTDPVILGNDASFDRIVPCLQGKSFQTFMDAIYDGTRSVFVDRQIPFCEISLEQGSAHDVGYFLQTKMIEVILLASLQDVNPFDQPNVEDYKVVTKKILAG